jgi:hypothetical protein
MKLLWSVNHIQVLQEPTLETITILTYPEGATKIRMCQKPIQ